MNPERERNIVTEQSCTRGVFWVMEGPHGTGSHGRAGVVFCMGRSDTNQYFAKGKNGCSKVIGLIIEFEAAENECVGFYDGIASNESEKAKPTEDKAT